MVDKSPKFEWRPDFPSYNEVNIQDSDEVDGHIDNIGPADT